MKPALLPYLEHPDEEKQLRDFLLARLHPEPNTPKTLIVHGPPGVDPSSDAPSPSANRPSDPTIRNRRHT